MIAPQIVPIIFSGHVEAGDLFHADATTLESLHNVVSCWRDSRLSVVLSSGEVEIGRQRLKIQNINHMPATIRAAAAVGQIVISNFCQNYFGQHGIEAAQILISDDDIQNRISRMNAIRTMRRLLIWSIVPIVAESHSICPNSKLRRSSFGLLDCFNQSVTQRETLLYSTSICQDLRTRI